MKDIKFRVWANRMIKWEDLAIPKFLIDDLIDKDLHEEDHHVHLATLFEFLQTDGLIFMQYTGLKDKHGVEIYEEDIVLPDDLFGIPNKDKLPIFIESIEYFHYLIVENYWRIPKKDLSDTLEIIGNVYENPTIQKTANVWQIGDKTL